MNKQSFTKATTSLVLTLLLAGYLSGSACTPPPDTPETPPTTASPETPPVSPTPDPARSPQSPQPSPEVPLTPQPSLTPTPSNTTESPIATWDSFEIGKSVKGRPIHAFRFGHGKRNIVFLGGIHGDEPNSVELMTKWVEDLKLKPPTSGVQVIVCPLVNPDALASHARKNAHNVDLNRNFPTKDWAKSKASAADRDYAGPSALSEPESQALMGLLKKYPPSRLISVHCPYQELNYDGPGGESLARAMAKANGYKVTGDIGYPTPGSLGTYYGKELKIPVITFELPPAPALNWKANREALWAATAYEAPATTSRTPAPPKWESFEIGASVEGRSIAAYRFGSGSMNVVFLGGFHGDEPNSVEFMKLLVADLKKTPVPTGTQVIVCPVLNPDGLQRHARQNSNGVDINRNFPTKNWSKSQAAKGARDYAGSAPLSEPESQAAMALLKRFPPARVVSVHCPYQELNYDGPGLALAQAMSKANGYKVTGDIGYPTPGSFGTYFGKERNIPIITFELPASPVVNWPVNREALWAAIRYQKR